MISDPKIKEGIGISLISKLISKFFTDFGPPKNLRLIAGYRQIIVRKITVYVIVRVRKIIISGNRKENNHIRHRTEDNQIRD